MKIQSLKARQQAVGDLQADRNTPVQLLGQLVDKVPDGVYLLSVRQEFDRYADGCGAIAGTGF